MKSASIPPASKKSETIPEKPRRPRRTDPVRKARIIEAALDVIAVHGVAGTTHRRIAEAADVPLGSMTYHFRGLEDVLEQAFVKLADDATEHFDLMLLQPRTREDAIQAVTDIIVDNVWASPRTLLLSYEFYAYVSRNPALRHLPEKWMRRSRSALGRHFDARTARALDALIEGLGIHNSFERQQMPRAEVCRLVSAVVTGPPA